MSEFSFNNIRIAGVAGAAPSKVIDNLSFYDMYGKKSIDDFIKLTGIERHHKSPEKQVASDLGFAAARELIEKKHINTDEIGAIIDVTQSGDYLEPATAFVIHKRLGLSKNCIAFDVNLGCSGYVNGIYIAASLLQSMSQKYVLLIAGDVRKFPNVDTRKHPDPSNFMMPGDCATATIVERTNYSSKLDVAIMADGENFHMLHKLGANRCLDVTDEILVTDEGVEYSLLDHYMDGMGVFSFSTTKVPKLINDYLTKACKTVEDYQYFFFHQANKMIVERISKKLKIDFSKVPLSLKEYGNTSSGSVPITIVYELGDKNDDDKLDVILCGFGVGLSWGLVSTTLSAKDVLPVVICDDYFLEGEEIVKLRL